MNAINLEFDILHYLDSDGDVIVEVYPKGGEDPILSTSVSLFGLVKEFVDIAKGSEDLICDSDASEAAYELVDELQDCVDYLNNCIEDPEALV